RAMKDWGYGAGYQHAHQFADAIPGMDCLPPELGETVFYEPGAHGMEERISVRLRNIRQRRAEQKEKSGNTPAASGPDVTL
ncbi:MAG: replication-associated recombination protein A, partial [Bryobacteraceae bacterium]|nr:replication-associated recombination protein A [Bryobacteraceae bacterium]